MGVVALTALALLSGLEGGEGRPRERAAPEPDDENSPFFLPFPGAPRRPQRVTTRVNHERGTVTAEYFPGAPLYPTPPVRLTSLAPLPKSDSTLANRAKAKAARKARRKGRRHA